MADERDIKVRISAEDQTSAGLKSASRGLLDFGKGAQGVISTLRDLTVAAAGIRAAFSLVASAGTKALVAFEESREAATRLRIAFKSQGEAAETSTRKALAFADSLSRITRFSDEQIAGAQALLATLRGLSGEGLERATRAAADLAETMEIDIRSAARLLAKGEESTTVFKRLGIAFSESEDPIAIVERTMGGAAVALNTAAGSVRDLKEAFGELLEGLGAILAIPLFPVFSGLGFIFRELGAFAAGFAESLGVVAKKAAEAVKGVNPLVLLLEKLDTAQLKAAREAQFERELPGGAEKFQKDSIFILRPTSAEAAKAFAASIADIRSQLEEAAPSVERFFGIGRFISDWKEMQALADEQNSVWGRIKTSISSALQAWEKGRADAATRSADLAAADLAGLQALLREQEEFNRIRREAVKFEGVSGELANASTLVESIATGVARFTAEVAAGTKGTDDLVAAQRRLEDAVAMVREAMASVSDLTPQQQKAFEGMLAVLETRLLAIDRAFDDAGTSARTADAAAKAAQSQEEARLKAPQAVFAARSSELAASIGGPIQSALVDALSGVRKENFRAWANELGTALRRSLANALTKPFFETLFKPIGDILARLVSGAVEGLAQALGIQIKKAVQEAAVEKTVGEVAGTGTKAGGGGGTNVSQTVSTVIFQPVGGIALQSVTTINSMVAAMATALITSITASSFISGVTFIAAGVIPAIVVASEVSVVVIGAVGIVGVFFGGLITIIGVITGDIHEFNSKNTLLVNVDIPDTRGKGDTIYFQNVGMVGMVGSWLSILTNANVGAVGLMFVAFGVFLVGFLPAIFFSGLVNAVIIGLIGIAGGLFFMGVINTLVIGSIGEAGRMVFVGAGNFVQMFIASVREISVDNASIIGGGGGGGILGFQHGGSVKQDTMAFLHAGEEVLTADDVKALSRGGGGRVGSISVVVNAAGGNVEDPAVVRKLSRALGREVERRIRRPGRGR